MNVSTDRLESETHARIFATKVVPESELAEALSHERPKAIILGGQPGAGKGGLANTAIIELRGDAVLIDPDELREFHPKVEEFRNTTPYTWSGRTHADAGTWADELREAAVAGRKNFIFDTTLSNGPWTADLIKDLQAKGYDVEVRAVAAHKLESELGVDYRFSSKLDKEGHGRHVPGGARDAIYDKVPAGLDTIRAQADVPIRIFSREGAELYDSRTDSRPPGQVLEEAREARLRDPRITRDLNRGWQAQANWHEDLPESISRNPKVSPETAQRLLTERSERGVVGSVTRDAAQAHHIDHVVRVRPNVIKGAGVIGAAATAYDIADTTHDVSRLRAQGNATAAEDRITRFAAQNLGGWGGAVAGMTAGAAAGVESGPGLLVTGAVGGVIGAVAGDQVAGWIRDFKINHQDDRQGNTWTFDPDKPERGWTRGEGNLFDQALGRSRTLTADAALSDELTFKASSQSIALALGAPPQNRDPYRIPVEAGNVERRSPFETGRVWISDPQTRQWKQEITELLGGRIPITRHEPASPGQAEALERQSQAIIAQNARQTPTAMAAQFQMAYGQNGWTQHGPLPEAVAKALRHPGQVVGSDGTLYERNAQGQWTHDGTLWDSRAQGNLQRELEATYQRQQADAHIPTLETVRATAPAPEQTQAAQRISEQVQTLADLPPQDQAMFARIRAGVPSHIADHVVAHAMLEAKKDGIANEDRIGRVALAGDKLWIAGTTPGFRVSVDVSAQTPAMQETVQATQVFNREQQLAMEAAQREQQQAQSRGYSV